MTYLELLNAGSKFFASRIYAQLMGAFFGFFFFLVGAFFALMGYQVAKNPETGKILMDVSWHGSWIFIISLLVMSYTLITLLVFLVALRQYWTCRADRRALRVGACMILLLFPLGTIIGFYLIWKLKPENQWDQ